MAGGNGGSKRQGPGLIHAVKAIFRTPKARVGPEPARDPLPNSQGASPQDAQRDAPRITGPEKPADVPTTIHKAVRDGSIMMIDRILRVRPGDLQMTDDQGMTPLALAVLHGNRGVAQHLYDAGASPLPEHNNDESLMSFAVISQNIKMVHWLCDLKDDKGTPAALLNTRDLGGKTPLHHAVTRRNIEITRTLLRRGADPNIHALETDPKASPTEPIESGTPLYYAVSPALSQGRTKVERLATTRLLLAHGAATDIPAGAYGVFALHEAVQNDDPALLDALLYESDASRRAPIDVGCTMPRDEPMRGTTPLMNAALLAKPAGVRYLLLRGADPAKTNALGETALHWAAAAGDFDSSSPDDGSVDERGPRVIHLLAERGDGENGSTKSWDPIPVDARTKLGNTPLHAAAWMGRMGNVKALLALGADPAAVAQGLHAETVHKVRGTPEDYARHQGHYEVAEVIKEWRVRAEKTRAVGEGNGEGQGKGEGEGGGTAGVASSGAGKGV